MMENESGGEDAFETLDNVDPFYDLALGICLEGNYQLTHILPAMHLGALDQAKGDRGWRRFVRRKGRRAP